MIEKKTGGRGRKATEAPIEEKELFDEDAIVEKESEPKMKKNFSASDGILCKSVTVGSLFMESGATKTVYRWPEYGSEIEVEYRDLATEVRAHSKFVFTPRFIIEDEDFLEQFPEVVKFYEENYAIKDLRKILKLDVDEMIKVAQALPATAFEQLRTIVSTQIGDGTLDSMRKIRALSELFNVDFSMFAGTLN
jgi:predicted nuclease of restriction endonuclease-like RecB superfamily